MPLAAMAKSVPCAIPVLPSGREKATLLLVVGFPAGGCAYLHRHQGPGIRCLVEGGMRIDTHGRSNSYGPGGAWFETGTDPVIAYERGDVDRSYVAVQA